MTYSPGPWFIQDQKRKDFIPIGPRSRSEDHIVAKVVCLERDNQKLDINISNAYLIAAAPELLEALKALASTARTFSDCVSNKDKMWTSLDEDALTAAFKTINKATGG